MNPERYRKIRELFEAALEQPAEERTQWITQACGSDAELRSEVQQMLSADALSGGLFEQPAILAAAVAARAREEQLPSLTGRRIGPYQILDEVGHGGMGAVYRAERADDAFHKQVAFKLLRPGLLNPDLRRRFQQEREILAGLDHPNIARLLDGGATEEGWPYFVMEYVDGQPIDRYCDAHKLSVTERLRLFQSVCTAVQYAHQNLIVHRDLKPSNILVTAEGAVKLLDFGIAKLLHAPGRDTTLLETNTGLRLMTPEYASPEQVKGEPVTTATDVYSLGVVLYELLTGHRPYRLKSRLLHEAVRIICEEEPTRPSTVVGQTEEVETAGKESTAITPEQVSHLREGKPAKLKKRLAGDLDNILLMSLRKEPQRRYGTVEQLSEDLHRHLTGLPLAARKDVFYRIGKFGKRHRTALLTATLTVLAAAAALSFDQSRKEQQQRLAAQDLFYSMKSLDVDSAGLGRLASHLDPPSLQAQNRQDITNQLTRLRRRRRELETGYDHLLATLGVYASRTEQDRLALRVIRDFGECELTVPPAFLTDVHKTVRNWQSTGRYAKAIRKAQQKGYIPLIIQELRDQGLPPQLLYIALQESGFAEELSGPMTSKGIAKGMWQFTPGTAEKYGLRIGPLRQYRQPDPADERLQWKKATHAAALYLKDRYDSDAQASALLTIALFPWEGAHVQPVLENSDDIPRERNFWRIFLLHRQELPNESYDYLLSIVSAAVIGENPRLFGFDFDNPIH